MFLGMIDMSEGSKVGETDQSRMRDVSLTPLYFKTNIKSSSQVPRSTPHGCSHDGREKEINFTGPSARCKGERVNAAFMASKCKSVPRNFMYEFTSSRLT